MRATLATVVMLQALITGDCLLCETCFAAGATQCSGTFEQCSPDVTHCFKGVENTTAGGDVTVNVFKDCLDPSYQAVCGSAFHLKNSVVSYWISTTCCDSDFCNRGDVEVPAVDETPNGYKCDECYTDQSSDSCTPTGEVECTGKQNTCTSSSGNATIPGEFLKPYSLKACVTQDYCELLLSMATQIDSDELLCIPAKKL
uniref:Sodefrin-like factor n=1 Tax=Ichthyosaura alpestris TaxID=54263 RepID=A0A0F7JG73_ICHAP|nr:sodefrin precursor-like factor [Ichthyosaura alpestris]